MAKRSWFLSILIAILPALPVRFTDSIRADLQKKYSPEIIELAGFECMVEMLLKMIYLEKNISEVPLVLDTNLREGKSKMKIIRTVRGYFKVWAQKKDWNPQKGI